MNYKVRVATPADASAIQAIYAPMVLETVISFELTPVAPPIEIIPFSEIKGE